jgi:Tat protein translocase TatB subunit
MFGPVGGPEFLLILVLALLLFGPRKLPQLGRTIGRALAELRGATQEFKSSLEHEIESERFDAKRHALKRGDGDAGTDAGDGSGEGDRAGR